MSPLQWVGLAVLVLLFLYQAGLLQIGDLTSPRGFLSQRVPALVALVLSITIHEFSHGLVATFFGDDLPRRVGRLTLNPLKHLDPLGTLMILIGPIGWGRPMPINPAAMRNPALGWAFSSIAGPVSNFLSAAVAAALLPYVRAGLGPVPAGYVFLFAVINVALGVFNLIPVPPLDGFGFIFGLAPPPIKRLLFPVGSYGPLILLALLFLPGILPGFPPILSDVLNSGTSFFGHLVGLRNSGLAS